MKRKLLTCLLLLAVLIMSSSALAWDTPCIDEPYDYSYNDDTRSIAIKKYTGDKSVCFVVDVQISDATGFNAEVSPDQFRTLSSMAQSVGAVLAINADDYNTHKYGIIIRNGETLRVHDTTRHLLAVMSDGSFQTVSDPAAEVPEALAQRLQSENVLHTFEFGPVLVENYAATTFPDDFDVISTRDSRREPRTAIGMIAPNHYVILIVDGRQPGYSEGVSLQTLQEMFVKLGVQTAFNLDGGGSTELWFQGEILNSPAGGRERKLSDFIWF